MKSRELALISLFASTWMAAQIVLGPIIGRFSLGPVSMHGVVNRLIGWSLMLVLANISGRLGNVSIMSGVAALGTRIIRVSALSGLVTGIGYTLGGLCFDILYFLPNASIRDQQPKGKYIIGITIISGIVSSLPYLLYKYLFLSSDAFMLYVPVHVVSMVKGVLFSIAGTLTGLKMLNKLEKMGVLQAPSLYNARGGSK